MSVVIRLASSDTTPLPRVVGGRSAAPEEWDQWSEEPGHELVAQDGTRVVGSIHVSLVGRSEAWMENLRVQPDARGRGVAAQLVREAETVARRYGAAVVRTAVPAHEYAALGVAERAGYRVLLRAAVVETVPAAVPVHIPYDAPVHVPPVEQTPALLAFVESAQTAQAWRRLVPLGWRFRRVTADLVRGLTKDRRVVAALHPGSKAVQAAALFALRAEALVVSLLDGTPPGVQAVFGTVAEDARAHGASRAVVFTPDPQVLEPLDVRGWTPHPWCPEGFLVVEKSIAS